MESTVLSALTIYSFTKAEIQKLSNCLFALARRSLAGLATANHVSDVGTTKYVGNTQIGLSRMLQISRVEIALPKLRLKQIISHPGNRQQLIAAVFCSMRGEASPDAFTGNS